MDASARDREAGDGGEVGREAAVDDAPGDGGCRFDGGPCPAGSVCIAGYCTRHVGREDYYYCDGLHAVSLFTSEEHCGACGHACSDAELCVDGACTPCAAGRVRCGYPSACPYTLTEQRHCGACGRVCGASESCVAGRCEACPSGTASCSDSGCAVSLVGDVANCGACGRACADHQRCEGGECVACPGGGARCGGAACIDTSDDPMNCGGCGVRCATLPRATLTCAARTCVAARCAPDTAECDGVPATPCETVLTLSASHCGACGRACASTESCASGRCVAVALRLRAPSSYTSVTSARPTLRWFLPDGATGGRVEVCRDAACATAVARADVEGDHLRLGAPLDAGVYHWRVTALRGGRADPASSATWQFMVDARPTGIHGYGADNSLGDLNGDGLPDRASAQGVWFGTADGAVPPYLASLGYYLPTLLRVAVLGDLDGDGYGDAKLVNRLFDPMGPASYSEVTIHGDPNARVASALGSTYLSDDSLTIGGDFDGNGRSDVAILWHSPWGGTLQVGDARHPLVERDCWTFPRSPTGPDLVVRDVNDDGYDDVEASRMTSTIRMLGGPSGLTVAPCDH